MSSVVEGASGVKARRKPQLSWANGLLLVPLFGFIAFFWYATHHVTKPEISIFDAAEAGDIQAVRDHITTGTPVDSLSGNGHTALFYAIQHRHDAIAELLLDHGAPVEAENRSVPTPLYAASAEGNADLVKQLLERGADANATSKNGLTPLHAAAGAGSPATIKLLLDSGAFPDGTGANPNGPPLCSAAAKGNLECVRLLVQHGAKVNATGFLGREPLHLAVARNHFDVAQFLLLKGGDADHQDLQGTLPIASALVHDDDPRLFWLLYKRTTRFNASDFNEGTLLHYAVQSNVSMDILDALLAKKLDVNRPDFRGQTPIVIAMAAGNVEAVKALEHAGARVPLRTLINLALAGPKQPKRTGFMEVE